MKKEISVLSTLQINLLIKKFYQEEGYHLILLYQKFMKIQKFKLKIYKF